MVSNVKPTEFVPTNIVAPIIGNTPVNTAENYIKTTFPESTATILLHQKSVLKLAQYYLNYYTQSTSTLTRCASVLKWYTEFVGKSADELIAECLDKDGDPDQKTVIRISRRLEDFVGYLRSKGLGQSSVYNYIQTVRTFYKANGIIITLTHPLPKRITMKGRSPMPDELQRLVDMADLREKVIVSMLALGGFRVGTLSKLQYRHIKRDLETGIVPVHIHIESNITKGKYGDYDTFIGKEAVDYLKAYFDQRRRGTPKLPPETITDTSPLIRTVFSKTDPLSSGQISGIVKRLYIRAGLITEQHSTRSDLVTHSLRKFFRTQLGTSIPSDYVEYMMGHIGSTYNDIESKGIEFLRNLYMQANFSIRPKTTLSEIDVLKTLIRSWGKDPEAYLSKEAMNTPHRATIGPPNDNQLTILQGYLRQLIKDDKGG